MPKLWDKTGSVSPVLNKNKIYDGVLANALFNMIISQRVFDLNVTPNTKLFSMVQEEVAGYGDKKLYYFADVSYTEDFIAGIANGNNQNLLETRRPEDVTVQEITLDNVRTAFVTVDDFLVKQAFEDGNGFSTLMGVFQSALDKTKQIHLAQTVNTYVGTLVPADQEIDEVTVSLTGNKEQDGGLIAEKLANTFTALEDISRDYTDDKYLRSFGKDQLVMVVNASYANMIQKRVLPFIFGPDKLTSEMPEIVVLPERYFGDVSSATSSVANARTLKEIRVSGKTYFPGDVIPTGTTVAANSTYTVDGDIICKIIAKDGIKMLTAYNSNTSFFNARSLNTNHYIHFGYSTPEYLVDYPVLTVKAE